MAVTREQVVQWLTQSEVSFFPNCKGDVIGDFDEVVELIDLARADLEATIAEQAKEIERLKADRDDCLALAKSNFGKIIESQAYAAQLREAIGGMFGPTSTLREDRYDVLSNALAIPSDDSALREYGAKLVDFAYKEGMLCKADYFLLGDKIRKG